MHSSAIAALVAAVTGLSQAPERRPPEFPADVRLIRLDVSVVDGRGRPAAGLSPSDFDVKEDGRPVAVTYFEAIRAEEVSAAAEIREPGSVTPPARRILLLVDTGRMSRGQLRRARKSV